MKFACLLLVFATSVQAQTLYRWKDADGTEHYTNDAEAVPMGVVVEKGSATIAGQVGDVQPGTQKTKSIEERAKELSDPKLSEAESAREDKWRRAFKDVNGRIAQLEDDIAVDEKRLEPQGGLPVIAQVHCPAVYPQYANARGLVAHPARKVLPPPLPTYPANTPYQAAPLTVVPAYPVNSVCTPYVDPELERIKDRVEHNRLALKRAKEELADLDRRASNEAVPREWRR